MLLRVSNRILVSALIQLKAKLVGSLAVALVFSWPLEPAFAAPKLVGATVEVAPATSGESAPASVLAEFYSAIAPLERGEFSAAAKQLELVKEQAKAAGYANLTEFSFQLLARAEHATSEGKADDAAFLARWAETLSPGDARIQLALAEFPAAFDGRGMLSRSWAALARLPSHPFLFAALAGTLLLVVLVAGTLGSLLVNVVLLLRHGESILEKLGKIFPYAWRGFGAISLLMLVLAAPLAGGLLLAIACWALVLVRYVSGCHRFSLAAGVLCLTWGLAIPIIGAARLTLASDLFRAMEEIHNDAYVPRAEVVLQEPSRGGPREPMVSFLLGVSQYREGNLKAAQNSFTKAAEGSGGLRLAAQINLGATALRMGDANAAKDALVRAEGDGGSSFELYYNLSQTYLQLLDTETARRYSGLALSADRARLAQLEGSMAAGSSTGHPPLLQHAPTASLLPLLLRTTLVGAAPAAVLQRNDQRTTALVGLLLVAGKTETVMLLGLLTIALGFFAANRAKHSASERESAPSPEASSSLVWFLIPGGGFLAAERPLIGAVVLTSVIACVLLAFGSPVRPLPGIPNSGSAATSMLALAGAVMLISTVVAARLRSRDLSAIGEE